MKRILIIHILAYIAFGTCAQDSAVYFKQLQQVEIVEQRATLQQLWPGPADKGLSMGNYLDQNSGNMVKYNGPVGVASINMGGLGGQHTAIVWNGVNLQSGMNGFCDLNLLPMFLFDELEMGTDFGSQPLGNGLGGTLKLNTKSSRNEIMLSHGSFYNEKIGVSVSPINGKRLKLNLKYYGATGQNNFPYHFYNKTQSLNHALFRQQHGTATLSYKINEKSQLRFDGWLMQAYRQIPPTALEKESVATQTDQNTRTALAYYYNHNKDNRENNAIVRLNYLKEHIGYTDSLKKIFGNNTAQNLFLIYKQDIDRLNYVNDVTTSYIFGASAGLVTASTLQYSENGLYSNASANFRFQQKGYAEKWLYNVGIKTEKFRQQEAFSFDANYKYRLNEKLKWSVFGGRAYRFPTLNELFWQPGGNPNLQTETAWKGHTQIEWLYKYRLKLWGQIHSAIVNNWIMWQPINMYVAQAQNVATVLARGIDINYWYTRGHYGRSWRLFGNYSFNNTQNLGTGSKANREQMIYVPHHKFNQGISLQLRRFSIVWQHQLVGRRYINPDNTEYLKAYQTDNLQVNYQTYKGFSLRFALNNMFNSSYQSTTMYPMPLRNFNLTINYNFNNLIKKYVK
ncbi:TonB-dependent receptor plug domain-containing protein [bacterium]|nr:TonB-dependent receptor plug domain-containing protein [bacterium]